jgi:bla regulator protein BlaR1
MTPAFLENELVRAFCWTLIHSLWQGLVLAAVTGLILTLTRRSHAKKRYGSLSVLFFLFLLVTAATFIREISLMKPATTFPVSSDRFIEQALTADLSVQAAGVDLRVGQQGWINRFIDYFNTHAAMVVTVWFIVFLAKLLRLGGNLFYVQRLRSYKTLQPAGEWKEKIKLLADKLGLCIQVQLLESAIVNVPVTMGVFKPIILLPVGLLAHLPGDEIEAILLHELAHIKRRDYFVNLLQSLAETIFFFNPALLWLSSLIRDERENCCDDIAISVTNNKTNFINALISFQEYHFAKPNYGMAFPGKKHQLLNRVKRIVSNSNKTLNAAEKSVLGFGVAILLFFSFVTAQQSLPKPIAKTIEPVKATNSSKLSKQALDRHTKPAEPLQPPAMEAFLTDTLSDLNALANPALDGASALAPISPDAPRVAKTELAQDTTIGDNFSSFSITSTDDGVTRVLALEAATKDGKKYTLKKVNNILEAFAVNGKQIPAAEFSNYRKEIDLMEDAYRSRTENAKARKEESRKRHEEQRVQHQRDMALKMERMNDSRVREDAKRQLERVSEKSAFERKKFSRKFSDSAGKVFEWKAREADRELIDHTIEMQKHMEIQKEHQIEIQKKKLLHEKVGDSLKRVSVVRLEKKLFDAKKEEWMRATRAEDNARVKESASVMRNIIDDLEKENVKVDSDKGWFALDPDKFIVDGKEMTKEQHDKFKSKYLTKNGWGYYYGHVKVSGRGIFLDNKDVPVK